MVASGIKHHNLNLFLDKLPSIHQPRFIPAHFYIVIISVKMFPLNINQTNQIVGSGCRGCEHIVVGFTTTCAISVFHHPKRVSSNAVHGEVYSILHYDYVVNLSVTCNRLVVFSGLLQ